MSQADFNQKLKNFFAKAKLLLKKFGNRAWQYIKIARIELILLFGLLILDLLIKFIVANTMDLGGSITVIPNFFNITYVHNTKAAFGQAFGLENILGDKGVMVFFIIITFISVGGFSFFLYYFRGKHILARVSLALIISGALGNFFDRLFLGYVRDFAEIIFFGLDLPIVGSSFAIFNIADVALVVGVIIFAVYFIFMYKSPKQEFVGPIYQPDCVKEEEPNSTSADEPSNPVNTDKYKSPIKDETNSPEKNDGQSHLFKEDEPNNSDG